MSDVSEVQNEDLVLKVSFAVDPGVFDVTRYEAFLDALCGTREYQKDAIRTTLRYLLGNQYADLRALAKENFKNNPTLRELYGAVGRLERRLLYPDRLSASLDLTTGTGKSYVLYGIAAIMLAEGAVDQALVLCPSLTIETGLTGKFRDLAVNADLRDLLPEDVVNIDYTKTQQAEEHQGTDEFEFKKGYVSLASQVGLLERETTYARAVSGSLRQKRTLIRYQMHSVDEHVHIVARRVVVVKVNLLSLQIQIPRPSLDGRGQLTILRRHRNWNSMIQ